MLALFLSLAIIMAGVPVLAQETIVQRIEVPTGEYSATDTYVAGDLWNEYIVRVAKGHELVYSFKVEGDGEIMVSLISGTHPNIYSDHFISFSTSQPVAEYTATFPAVIGFDRDYSIVVNSSHSGDVHYTAEIRTVPVEAPDYTLYYVLAIIGFVALVFFSYRFVLWQEEQEKKSKKADREKRRGKRRR